MTGLGIGFAAPPLVYVGVAMVMCVAVAVVWMLVSVKGFLAMFPHASRVVTPLPLTAGALGSVKVTLDAGGAHRRSAGLRKVLASALDIREQAAAELTGGFSTKATVARTSQALSLTYTLLPTKRGRWRLGPALIHSTDPLGILWSDTAVGGTESIPVWPAVVDLSGTAGALMGHADRIVLGARTPSPDDASLRDYRDGDDMRRVHWPSTARTGTMMVRSDERAGLRPATIVVDLPQDDAALEWTITLGASVAVSILESGHPVRLLGGGIDGPAVKHVTHESIEVGRARLLNSTVDLTAPESPEQRRSRTDTAFLQLSEDLTHGEVVVAIVGALNSRSIAPMTPIGNAGRAWALVREDGDAAAAQATAAALRRVGWRTVVTANHADVESSWLSLVTTGDER